MIKVLITGATRGIGRATAIKFLDEGDRFEVMGLDREPSSISNRSNYKHYICDIRDKEHLPAEIKDVNILVNNAGVQNDNDIDTNLKGTINITEKYGITPHIKSILMVASSSAHTGAEFPEYSASKGGLLAYTKNVALRIARYRATCNSISPGGVLTELNKPVMENKELWDQIMSLTPLKRWATPEEIADWIYFMTVTNKFATGQDILMDGGESTDAHFIWVY